MWLGIAALVFAFQKQIGETLKITNPTALWITVVLGLSSLCLPILRGVLQGAQNFFGLGWIAILDGAARFVAVVLIIRLGGQAAGAMTGALAGQIIALSAAFWLTRSMLRGASAPRPWSAWLKNAIPLSLASSSVLLMTGADVIFVQSTFPKTQTQYYIGAQIIGVALVMLTSPVAAVMFPKIVESATHAQRTDALQLALGGTALITGAAALACTLMPELPLRILYFRKPEYWRAAVLIPWFAWALLPLILANLLVNNLMARGRFAVAPWLALVAAAYVATLLAMRSRLGQMEMFNAFKTIIGTLGLFSTLLLIAALLFTRRETIAVEPGKSAIISDATPHDD